MPEGLALQDAQREFAAHLRDPTTAGPPAGIESRRMEVYRELIYNNIESFLQGGFPVTRSLYSDRDWHRLVRCFVRDHRCHTPYFYEISQEFIQFLMQDYAPGPADPPFLTELAHYEWVELALSIDQREVDQAGAEPDGDLLTGVPVLSPLVWSLQYRYPVHRIGPGSRLPEAPAEDTYLVVYRNRADQVKFMESNAATARLLQLLRENPLGLSGNQLLRQLAEEMKAESVASLVTYGLKRLRQFAAQDILAGVRG